MNNTELDFPAIMNDGRLFTDYRSSCILNAPSIQLDSLTYRNTLQNNAEQLIKNISKGINLTFEESKQFFLVS